MTPRTQTPSHRTFRLDPNRTLFLFLFVAIVLLAVVPLGFLLTTTFFVRGSFTLENFRKAFGDTVGIGAIARNTLTYATGSMVFSLTVGTTLAYLAVRTDAPFRRLTFVAALVPLMMPLILHTLAWLFLGAGRTGWLNALPQALFHRSLFDIQSMGGMIFVEGTIQTPLVFLLMFSAFRNMDPALEESALTHGARLRTVIRRITLPLAKPTILSAAFVMLVLGLESFQTPALLGLPKGISVFTTRIWQLLGEYPQRFGEAGSFSVVLCFFTAIGVWAYSRLGRKKGALETVTGKGFRPQRYHLGGSRRPMGAFIIVYFVIQVVLPLGMLLSMALLPIFQKPSAHMFGEMTLQNFRYAFSDAQFLTGLRNSLLLGISAAVIVMTLMMLTAWVSVRSRLRGAWILDALAFLPISVPGIVLGAALLITYLRVPIPIYATLWILLLAYCTKYMPYGMRYSTGAMHQIGRELEEASRTSGAGTYQTLRRIVLPLVAPGFVAGFIWVMVQATRELPASVVLYAPGTQVLGVVIWNNWEAGMSPQLSAEGLLMILLAGSLTLLARFIAKRFGVQESSGAMTRF
jgi:iron(III) transport system permease protein